MTTRFVILAMPRSGTNYFISRLVYCPSMMIGWEPFNNKLDRWIDNTPLYRSQPAETRAALTDVSLRNRDHELYYESIFSPNAAVAFSRVSAIGFKIFPSHSPRLFWRMTKEPRVKVIVIERTNRLDSFVSYLVASKTGSWINDPTLNGGSHHFDPEYFELYCDFVNSIYAGIKSNLECLKANYLYLTYDQIIASDQPFINTCTFLEAKYARMDSFFRKQMKISPIDVFDNRDFALAYLARKHPEFTKELIDTNTSF